MDDIDLEDILWDDDINNDDSEILPGTEEVLRPEDTIVLGSRFDGVTPADLPSWLRILATTSNIININGSLYFYTGIEGGWFPLRSSVTLSLLCKALNLYAPVNYAIAAEPYVSTIESVPWPVVIVANTFTQGRLRYTYTVNLDTGVIKFVPNNVIGGDPTPKNTLCTIPVTNVNPILKFNLRYRSSMLRRNGAVGWLHRVFGNNLVTVLWALGDMLYDSPNKRLFMFYGPGGVGKSTVANILGAVVGGTIPSLASQFVAINPKSFSRSTLGKSQLMQAASSRLVNIPDVEARKDDELHIQNVKSLTGGDAVDGIKVSTTLVTSVNKLFRYESQVDYTQPDRIRRVIVIPTVVERDGVNVDNAPLFQNSLDELVQFAIRTRIKHKLPPLKADALLATMFQDRYKDALELITIDYEAALHECMTATMLLCWRFDIQLEVMSRCLKVAGCSCAVISAETYFIAHIKPLAGHSISHLDSPEPTSYSNNYNRRNRNNRTATPLFS